MSQCHPLNTPLLFGAALLKLRGSQPDFGSSIPHGYVTEPPIYSHPPFVTYFADISFKKSAQSNSIFSLHSFIDCLIPAAYVRGGRTGTLRCFYKSITKGEKKGFLVSQSFFS